MSESTFHEPSASGMAVRTSDASASRKPTRIWWCSGTLYCTENSYSAFTRSFRKRCPTAAHSPPVSADEPPCESTTTLPWPTSSTRRTSDGRPRKTLGCQPRRPSEKSPFAMRLGPRRSDGGIKLSETRESQPSAVPTMKRVVMMEGPRRRAPTAARRMRTDAGCISCVPMMRSTTERPRVRKRTAASAGPSSTADVTTRTSCARQRAGERGRPVATLTRTRVQTRREPTWTATPTARRRRDSSPAQVAGTRERTRSAAADTVVSSPALKMASARTAASQPGMSAPRTARATTHPASPRLNSSDCARTLGREGTDHEVGLKREGGGGDGDVGRGGPVRRGVGGCEGNDAAVGPVGLCGLVGSPKPQRTQRTCCRSLDSTLIHRQSGQDQAKVNERDITGCR
mmetsp:Transcript_12703/g.40134  ORF Transcript_12703/g.40134 Transcript_12703/m.40134 type:complete len:401 (+) Transcript_12703:278-1480(+)